MRTQEGHVRKCGQWWRLFYRDSRVVDGKLKRVLVNVALCEVNEEYRAYRGKPTAAVLDLAQQRMKEIENRQQRVKPERVLELADFMTRVYLPHADTHTRPATAKEYRKMWHTYLEARAGDRLLRDVRTYHIQQLLEQIAQTHDLSTHTLQHIKALLSGAFRHALQQDFDAGENPVHEAKLPPARRGGKTPAYSLDEARELIAAVPEPASTILAVAAYTGLRRSEIMGLEWQDYCDAEVRQNDGAVRKVRVLQVRQSIVRGHASAPKSEQSGAPVLVVPQLQAVLDLHKLRCGNSNSELKQRPGDSAPDPMFRNGAGKPLDLNNLLGRVILPHLRKCKTCGKCEAKHDEKTDHLFERDKAQPTRWHGWHAFRRGLATNLDRLGVKDTDIQQVLRHADVATTRHSYIKSVPVDVVEAMETFSRAAENELLSERYQNGQIPGRA